MVMSLYSTKACTASLVLSQTMLAMRSMPTLLTALE